MMLTNLKEASSATGLILAPKEIFVDFEQGAIKAFKFHFPGAKITGCHFHFTSAIYKKLCELGMKIIYSDNNKFKKWVRMLMCLPFLSLKSYEDEDHIDVCRTSR
jgi:hypothetical protein